MNQIDSALLQLTRRDTVLEAVAVDSQPKYLSVWLDAGVPRKLVVGDSSEQTGLVAQHTFWFVGGEVAVAQKPFDIYAFDNDRMVLWTDEVLDPRREVEVQARMEREAAIIGEARRWLAVFGIVLP